MNCREVEDLMSAYLLHELDPLLTSQMEHHIAACLACQDWQSEVGLGYALWTQQPSVPSIDFVPAVMSLIVDVDAVAAHNRPAKAVVWRSSGLQRRQAMIHYGVAALLTVALFHFGMFVHVSQGAHLFQSFVWTKYIVLRDVLIQFQAGGGV